MPLAEMKKLAEFRHCKCGGCLTIAWGGAFGVQCKILRCGRDVTHTQMESVKPWSEKDRQINDDKRRFRNHMPMNNSLTILQPEEMKRRFADAGLLKTALDPNLLNVIVGVALQYQLDPLMGEIMIYQGRLYVTRDGRLRNAQESGQFDGIDTRPANLEEKQARGLEKEDYLFRAEAWVKGASHPFVGWGTVKKKEVDKKNTGPSSDFLPIVNDPAAMAEKRAQVKALKLAFHLNLPSAEDVGSEEDAPAVKVTEVKKSKKQEVIEVEGHVVKEKAMTDEEGDKLFDKPQAAKPAPQTESVVPTATPDANTDFIDHVKEVATIQLKWKVSTLASWINSCKAAIGLNQDVKGATVSDLLKGFTPEQARKTCELLDLKARG
jgi:hypothetical protein